MTQADLLILAGDIADMPPGKKAWLLGYIASMHPKEWAAALAAYSEAHKEAA